MKVYGLFCVLMFILFMCLPNNSLENSLQSGNKSDVLEKWMKLDKKLKSSVQSAIKQLMPTIIRSSGRLNLTAQCMKDAFQLITGLRNLKKWAFSFVDSSAKSLDGILSNSVTNLGVYDQCLDIVVPSSRNHSTINFKGQYCTVHLTLPLPKKNRIYRLFDRMEELRNFSGTDVMNHMKERALFLYYYPLLLGVCIPSGCTEDDLNQMLKVATEDYYIQTKVHRCEVKNEKTEFMAVQIFAIFCCCILTSLLLLGTGLEIFSIEKKNKLYNFIGCFSAISNFQKIFRTESSNNFRSLHGIRFLSITWVIFGHSYLFSGWYLQYYKTLERVQHSTMEPFAQTVMNSSVVVDTFFFMSGLLVCYLTIKHVKLDKNRFNIIQFLVHRLWRIVPVYYFIMLCILLVPLMGSGPIFQDVMDDTITPCYTNWWMNLLFINNYSDVSNTCMIHLWYVACDVQLYLASLLVLLPLLKSEKVGVAINVIIIIASIIYTGLVTHFLNASFTILNIFIDKDDRRIGLNYIYGNVLTRAGPYFIGTLVGYILVTRPNIKIPKAFQVLGWCLATISASMVVYASAIWFNIHLPSQTEILLYASLYNVAFTSGIAWMTFCCITGRGGFIDRILSWKPWIPLSKLTFTMYLIQPVFQIAYISVFRSTQEFTHLHMIVQAFGFICISALLALIINLLVESPFLAMEKVLFRKEQKTLEDTDKKTDMVLTNGNGKISSDSNFTICHINDSKDNGGFHSNE